MEQGPVTESKTTRYKSFACPIKTTKLGQEVAAGRGRERDGLERESAHSSYVTFYTIQEPVHTTNLRMMPSLSVAQGISAKGKGKGENWKSKDELE